MRLLVFFSASLLLFSCRPLEPSGHKQEPTTASLTVELDAEALQLVEDNAGSIKYAFKSGDDEPYTVRYFPFAFGPATFKDLRLGQQTMVVEVVDENGDAVALSESDLDLLPGAQTFDGEFRFRFRSVFGLAVKVVEKTETEVLTTFADVEPILHNAAYNCAGVTCHAHPALIDMQEFPYKSTKYNDDQVAIVNAILDRVRLPIDDGFRMPRGAALPSIPADEIDVIQDWMDDGLLVESTQCMDPMEWLQELKCQFTLNGEQKSVSLKPDENQQLRWDTELVAETVELKGSVTLVDQDGAEVMTSPLDIRLSPESMTHVTIEVPCKSGRGLPNEE